MPRRRLHLTALGLYGLFSLLLTWPLLVRITTHVPGVAQWAFDESTFVWNIWYFKHALVDNGASPLHTELIRYPLGIDLVLYTYNFFHALLAQAPSLAVNYAFGSNVTYLLSTLLSGYGTFLLVRYLLGEEHGPAVTTLAPPLLAGLLYAFASNRAVYATLGHYDMTTTQWIPFYGLMLLRALDRRLAVDKRRRSALLAGLFFAWNGLAEMITAVFLAIFTLIVLVVLLLWQVKRPNSGLYRESSRRPKAPNPIIARIRGALWIGMPLLVIGVTAFLIWSPALLPILNQFLTDDFSLKGWGEAIPLSTDLLGWFTPTVLHPLWGGDLVAELRRVQLRALELGVTGLRDVNTVFLGWVSLGLAVVGGLAYRRQLRLWIWTAVLFGLFTLGPFLQINGQYRFDLDGVEATFPLPYALLHYIPIVKANRAPNRNSVLLMLALAVLAAYGLRLLLNWLSVLSKRRTGPGWGHAVLALLLCVAVVGEHLAWPLPLSDARTPAVYQEIARDPRPVSVLNLPLGWRNSFGTLGPERTQLQYYQTVHGKPMLGGNISRAPDFKMDYFARLPYFDALTRIQSGLPVSEELLRQAAAQGPELMALYQTGYVILHPPIPQRFPYADYWQAGWDFVRRTLPLEEEPFWSQDGIQAYRVLLPDLQDNFRLDLGVPGTFAYRGEGWDGAPADAPYGRSATWATAQESRLFFALGQIQPDQAYTIALHVHPFAYGGPGQTLSLALNGLQLESRSLQEGWQEVAWTVAGHQLQAGLNRLVLAWDYAVAPRSVLPGDRTIGTTGVTMPVDVEIKSFVDGAFMALFDEEGEQVDGSAGRAGVNVTVLDAQSGEIVAKEGFDTTANQFEDQALTRFLASIAPGQIVLAAARGQADAYLSQASLEALNRLGGDLTLERVAGNYFAVAGVQGAEPGSGVTAVGANEAFVAISLNRDRRTLAAAVDWVEIGRE